MSKIGNFILEVRCALISYIGKKRYRYYCENLLKCLNYLDLMVTLEMRFMLMKVSIYL